jgi:TatA/E family protein of Tat protein translocase
MMLHTVAIAWPGPFEMILLAGLGLLIFGKRLPEVGRNIGKGIVEFKRGLKETETELNEEPQRQLPSSTSTAPKYKFDPYTGKPVDEDLKEKETSNRE